MLASTENKWIVNSNDAIVFWYFEKTIQKLLNEW